VSTYKHTQIGWIILLPVGLALAGASAAVIAAGERPGVSPAAGIGMGVLVLVALLFSALTVEISDGVLACRFGPGLIRRHIRLAEVRQAEPVRNRWYYGWGIRWIGSGWMWNVAGLSAVELTYLDGRKFRIGTDEPEALCAAIRPHLTPPTGGT
jgi:hypothetical protein